MGSLKKSSGGKVIAVEKVFNHPSYNSATFLNDVSLLKLAERVEFSASIQPITLSESTNTDGADGALATVTG